MQSISLFYNMSCEEFVCPETVFSCLLLCVNMGCMQPLLMLRTHFHSKLSYLMFRVKEISKLTKICRLWGLTRRHPSYRIDRLGLRRPSLTNICLPLENGIARLIGHFVYISAQCPAAVSELAQKETHAASGGCLLQ